ncbi:hypothetical protein [Kitasatospora sp. CMC57]
MTLSRRCPTALAAPVAALLWPAAAMAHVPGPVTGVRSLTAVTCVIGGSGSFANSANTAQGITNLSPRSVDVTASASGSCLDLRTDKSATGGHGIVSRAVNITGHLDGATCVLASGHYEATATWTLDDSSTVTSTNSIDIAAGNFLENVPGLGAVGTGLFSGATVENNTVLTNALANTTACTTTTGLKNYTFVTQVNVVQ